MDSWSIHLCLHLWVIPSIPSLLGPFIVSNMRAYYQDRYLIRDWFIQCCISLSFTQLLSRLLYPIFTRMNTCLLIQIIMFLLRLTLVNGLFSLPQILFILSKPKVSISSISTSPLFHWHQWLLSRSINVCMTIHLTLLSNNSISHFSHSCTRIDSNCNGHRRGRVCYICMCVMEGSSTMLHLLGWSSKQPNQIVLQVPGDTHRFWPPGSGTCPGSLQAQGWVLLHRECWGEQDPFSSQ